MSAEAPFLEEKANTSTVDIEPTQWPVRERVPLRCSPQFLKFSTTTSQILEPMVTYITMPRLRSDFFVDFPAIEPKIRVLYKNLFDIYRLLGDKGKRILDRVISLAEDFSAKQNWPIVRIEISLTRDEEVQGWQYILLRLIFDSDFESADNFLRDFYPRLDALADSMNEEDEHLFRRMFFFDVGTVV